MSFDWNPTPEPAQLRAWQAMIDPRYSIITRSINVTLADISIVPEHLQKVPVTDPVNE